MRATWNIGDTVVVDLPKHPIGKIIRHGKSRTKPVLNWTEVQIGFQNVWYPDNLLFVIPPEWETTGIRR